MNNERYNKHGYILNYRDKKDIHKKMYIISIIKH